MKIYWNAVKESLSFWEEIASQRAKGHGSTNDNQLYDMDELICQLFDDTGLGDAIESGELPKDLDDDTKRMIVQLYNLWAQREDYNRNKLYKMIYYLSRDISKRLRDISSA